MFNDTVYTRECLLDKNNSTVHFAYHRNEDVRSLTLDDFRRQRWIYFRDGNDLFMLRHEHIVSLEFID